MDVTPADDTAPGPAVPTGRGGPGRWWFALAVVAAVVLVLLSAWRQGWFTPTTHVYLFLPRANGLQDGMPVKVKGFVVGEVDEIVLRDNLEVRVRLRLPSAKMALLGADAQARVARDGPIGGKYIDILPGAREGRRLAAGQKLPLVGGAEIEDVMSTVKLAVEKLTLALDKVNPILDDTRVLTGEAAAMRETLRATLTGSLAEIRAMSGHLRQSGERARTLVGHVDEDRARLVAQVGHLLEQANAAAGGIRASLGAVEAELPQTLKLTRELLSDARDSGADVKRMLGEVRGEIPVLVQSGRSAAQDAAEMAQGLKGAWPLSGLVSPPASGDLPLGGYEGTRP